MAQLPRYRDTVRPAPLDVSTADNGSADAAAAQLGQVFEQFSARTSAVAGGLAQQAGATAGETAGAAGAPEPKTGFEGLSRYGQAYNSAAEAAYMSKLEREVTDKMNDIERQSEADPDGYEQKAGAMVGGYQDVLPAYKTRVMDMIDRHVINSRTKIRDQKLTLDRQQHVADFNDGQSALIQDAVTHAMMVKPEDGDKVLLGAIAENDSRLAALQRELAIDPVAAERSSQAFKLGLTKALNDARAKVFTDKLETQARVDAVIADQQFAAVMGRSDIDPEVRAMIEHDYNQMRTDLHSERARQLGEQSATLSAALGAGEFGPQVIAAARQLFKVGASGVDEYQGFRRSEAENARRGAEKAVDIQMFQDLVLGAPGTPDRPRGVALDPSNPTHQKMVDAGFDAMTKQAGVAPGSESWMSAAERVTERTNVMPTQVDSFIRSSMLAEDPTVVARGAAAATRMQRANNFAWEYNRDPKTTAFVRVTNDMMEGGASPKDAVAAGRRLTYEADSKQTEALERQYNRRSREITTSNPTFLQSVVDSTMQTQDPETGIKLPFFGRVGMSAPPAPDEMKQEYETLVRGYYNLTGGDLDKAREIAGDHIKSRWGITHMNGPAELVKYPPERYYPGLTAPMIREDLVATLNGAGYTGSPNDVTLHEIPGKTDLSHGKIWGLVTKNVYGSEDTVRDGFNAPIVLKMDVDKISEQIKVAKGQALQETLRLQREAQAQDAAFMRGAEPATIIK